MIVYVKRAKFLINRLYENKENVACNSSMGCCTTHKQAVYELEKIEFFVNI